jgi:hypothetical protein
MTTVYIDCIESFAYKYYNGLKIEDKKIISNIRKKKAVDDI